MPSHRLNATGVAGVLGVLFVATGSMSPTSTTSAADDFQPEEVLVSDPRSPVIDPEFDPLSQSFAWVNRSGELWVGAVDESTGHFIPPDGRGTLVDASAATAGELANGPEWVLTAEGSRIVYTRRTKLGYQLASASLAAGHWIPQTLKGSANRFGPYGSLDVNDRRPRILYRGPQVPNDPESPVVNYWRDLQRPGSETPFGPPGSQPGRWVPGAREIIYTARVADDEFNQAFLLDIDSGAESQITWNTGRKQESRIWTAPDFDGRRLMSTIRNADPDYDVIEIYVEEYDAALQRNEWILLSELMTPVASIGPYLWNVRPFVFKGLSYLVLCVSDSNDSSSGRLGRTEIWITSVSAPQSWRKLSDDVIAKREDPEVKEINDTAYVYAFRYQAVDGSPNGTYKLATGL